MRYWEEVAAMHKIPVIIDTDPGIDDFFALAVAAASDKLDIRAITPVAGNQTYEKVCSCLLYTSRCV